MLPSVAVVLGVLAAAPSPAAGVRYLKGQLHLHSARSKDSQTPPTEVIRWYREHGYDFIVFTDHNRAGAPAPEPGSPLVLPGVELTQNLDTCTPPPEAGEQCLLHVNALLVTAPAPRFDPWIPGAVRDRLEAYRQGLRAALELGAIAQLNHPNFHHGADASLLFTLVRDNGLRFFEIANGSFDAENRGDAKHPSTEEIWDELLTAGAWIFGTATDDAHHYYDAEAAARRGEAVYTGDRGFVMVRAARDATAIREALLRGDFYSSSGVLLQRAELENGRLYVAVAPSAKGKHRITFVGAGGRVLARKDARAADFALKAAPAGYLRAVVEDAHGRKAWLQPVKVPGPQVVATPRPPKR